MKNIQTTVKGDILTITVDLAKTFGRSASGKSTIIASTEGNQPVDGQDGVAYGVNVYKKG